MAVSPLIHPGDAALEPGAAGSAVFLEPGRAPVVRRFGGPVAVVSADTLEEVGPALREVERRVDAGLYAAGYVAFEAGAAFEPALPRRSPGNLPYVWFALYDAAPQRAPLSPVPGGDLPALHPEVSREEYAAALDRIRGLIADGDTYQVNLTFPMRGAWSGDARGAFRRLAASQQDAAHRCFLDLGSHRILSVSPELFFGLDGERIVTRPMKGTARRHPDPLKDVEAAENLRKSGKERAENLMIVDLIRNDLGRIAETGSVRVDGLFEVERYETLWTMTSSISARTRAGVPEIFAALFPSGSVTGAPKIRTMQIIHELEGEPRGVYCGAIGWWGPGRQAEFSVGIRTLVLDAREGTATYRVGSGITWDSRSDAEYDECLLKARVLGEPRPAFELLESLRLEDGEYWLLDRHVARMRTSAGYFGFAFDEEQARACLQQVQLEYPRGAYKIRVLLSESGEFTATCAPLGRARRWRVGVARRAIASQSPFVYHKTTHRGAYDAAVADCAGLDDVILFNERGELTETARANLVVEVDGEWLTPPRGAGLLPGTFREDLLESGAIRERSLTLDDLRRASRVRLINSVRGWIEVDLVNIPRP